jgi:tRNA threonylcarbamoyladenosine biosynthesis protein TsaE
MTELMTADDHALIVKTITWPDEDATRAWADQLAQHSGLAHALITLHGDLGAGKTTLARHLLTALGVQGRIKSPTYAVVEAYTVDARALSIWHFDFYRFNDPDEWEEAGFRDVFASEGLKLVEWPDKAGDYLPLADLAISLESLDDTARRVTLTAHTALGRDLIAAA